MFYGTSYVDKGDGSLENVFFTKAYEDYTLYYRKLIAEGLLDPEAFTQTDPIANEKIKQGRIAVLAAHYPAILDASKDYVKSHPGSDYVLRSVRSKEPGRSRTVRWIFRSRATT